MKKFTQSQKIKGELACRELSEKAFDFLTVSDPLSVYEIEAADKKSYSIRGIITADNLTFAELDSLLTEYATECEEE